MKWVKASESSMISISDFNNKFDSVSRETYEGDPSVIAGVIERVNHMRVHTIEAAANERMK